MKQIKKGDIVGRKSYGKDIYFVVANIIDRPDEKIAILRGLVKRIEADSKISDLELIDKKEVKKILEKSEKRAEKRVEKVTKQLEDRDYKIGIVTNNKRTKEKIITGKILHLDGDSCIVKNLQLYKKYDNIIKIFIE